MTETDRRAETDVALPVLSVTKSRGPMLASERFGKIMHGRDLKRYRVAPRNSVVADPMLLWDGSIGLQTVVDAGLVSPDYRVYELAAQSDPNFLGYLVRSPNMLPHYQGGARGTNVRRNRIARSDFLAIPIALPPLGEQKKIAAILSSVDEAIEATQAVIDQLQVVKKAMMAELLTRGLPGRHTRFKQTAIGEVPEEWDLVRIGEVCERMFVGIAQAATHAYVKSNGVPLVRTTNVRPNLLRTDDLLQISPAFALAMRSKQLRAGDVLSARTGYPGTSAVVPPKLDGAQCFTLLVSRPGPRLRSHYLCHTMNSPFGAEIVRRGQAGGAQQNLNVGVFEQAMIALPALAEQDAISTSIDYLYVREAQEQSWLLALHEVKRALMNVLLTGEVRVATNASNRIACEVLVSGDRT